MVVVISLSRMFRGNTILIARTPLERGHLPLTRVSCGTCCCCCCLHAIGGVAGAMEVESKSNLPINSFWVGSVMMCVLTAFLIAIVYKTNLFLSLLASVLILLPVNLIGGGIISMAFIRFLSEENDESKSRYINVILAMMGKSFVYGIVGLMMIVGFCIALMAIN